MTQDRFELAEKCLRGVVLDTKLIYSEYYSRLTGNKVYLKPENMQITGSYKVRGAYFKVSTLTPEEKSRGLITASAGNHAQGVAFAAGAARVPATIVMPATTPLVKVNNTKDYGAKVSYSAAVSMSVMSTLFPSPVRKISPLSTPLMTRI